MRMREPHNPTNLRLSQRPAFIHLNDGREFVANAKSLGNGWLLAQHWDGTEAEYPPHAIQEVEFAEREKETDKDGQTERIMLAAQDLIDYALSIGGESE